MSVNISVLWHANCFPPTVCLYNRFPNRMCDRVTSPVCQQTIVLEADFITTCRTVFYSDTIRHSERDRTDKCYLKSVHDIRITTLNHILMNNNSLQSLFAIQRCLNSSITLVQRNSRSIQLNTGKNGCCFDTVAVS